MTRFPLRLGAILVHVSCNEPRRVIDTWTATTERGVAKALRDYRASLAMLADHRGNDGGALELHPAGSEEVFLLPSLEMLDWYLDGQISLERLWPQLQVPTHHRSPEQRAWSTLTKHQRTLLLHLAKDDGVPYRRAGWRTTPQSLADKGYVFFPEPRHIAMLLTPLGRAIVEGGSEEGRDLLRRAQEKMLEPPKVPLPSTKPN